MKKRVFGRKLSRERATRRALFRSLARALVLHGEIKTTKAKAKAVQGYVDKLITTAKKDTIAARRRVFATLGNDKEAAKKFFEVAKLFTKRNGGFTRLVNLGTRKGDRAELVRISLLAKVEEKREVEKPKRAEVKKNTKLKAKKATTKKETK